MLYKIRIQSNFEIENNGQLLKSTTIKGQINQFL
jgi:hypothetical protein